MRTEGVGEIPGVERNRLFLGYYCTSRADYDPTVGGLFLQVKSGRTQNFQSDSVTVVGGLCYITNLYTTR